MPQEVKPAFLPASQNRNTGFFNFGGGGSAGGGGIFGSAIKTFADAGISAARDLAFGPTEEEKAKQLANNETQYKGAERAFADNIPYEKVKELYPELSDEQLNAIRSGASSQTRAYYSGKETETLKKLQEAEQAKRMAPVVAGGTAAGNAVGEQVSAPVTAESKANIAQMQDTQTGLDKSLEYAPSETASLIDPQAKAQGMGTNQVADETSNLMMDYSPEHPEFVQVKNDMVSHLSANPERVKMAAAADENFDYLLHSLNWQHAANNDRTVMASGQFSPKESMKTQEDQQMMSLSQDIFSNWKDTRLVAMGLPPTLMDDAPLDAVLQSLAFRDPAAIQTQEQVALSALAQAKQAGDSTAEEAALLNLKDIEERKELAERGSEYLKSLPLGKRASLELFLSSGPLKGAVAASKSASGLKNMITLITADKKIKSTEGIAAATEAGKNSRAADTNAIKRESMQIRREKLDQSHKEFMLNYGQKTSQFTQQMALKIREADDRKGIAAQRSHDDILKTVVGIQKTKASLANSRLAAAEKMLAGAQASAGKGIQTTTKKAEAAKQQEALAKNVAEARAKYEEAVKGIGEVNNLGIDSPPVIYGPGTPEYFENVLDVDMSNLDPETGLKLSKSIDSLLKGKSQPTLRQYDVFLVSQGYTEDQRKTALKMYQEGLKNNGVISK